MAWTVDFYEDADGNAPVEIFLTVCQRNKDTDKLEKSDIEAAKSNMADHNRKLVRKVKLSKSDPKVKGK
jgi:hypothetical protein